MRIWFFVFWFFVMSSVVETLGQTRSFSGQSAGAVSINKISSTTDTLTPPSFSQACYNNQNILYYADYYTPHDSGFVTGNNIYGDLEKAQLYVNTQTVVVTGCLALVNVKASGSAVNATIRIYSKNTSTGNPQTLLATSLPIAQSSLSNNNFNTFTFNPPVTLTTDFFVSYVLPQNNGDTTGVYSTYVTCHSTSTLAYEKAGDGSWGKIKTNWGFASGNDLDLVLLPLIQNNSTGIQTNTQTISWTQDNSNLLFRGIEQGELQIINAQGQICSQEFLQGGQKNISELPHGLYFFYLKSGNHLLKGNFIKF